jgi:hypothetical protein
MLKEAQKGVSDGICSFNPNSKKVCWMRKWDQNSYQPIRTKIFPKNVC